MIVWMAAIWAGCASVEKALDMSASDGPGGAELDATANQLRIDIIPGETTPWLDKQSWVADPNTEWGELEIDILPSVRITGQVLGYSPTPYGAEVPGADQTPVLATVALVRDGTISGASVTTDEAGFFAISVPPARGYTMTIIPHDAETLPFMATVNADFESAEDLGQIDLGYGEPVHGVVLDSSLVPVAGATLHLVDQATGAIGGTVQTDDEGRYLLRALPGEYTIVVKGQAGRAIPRLARTIEVVDGVGATVEFNMGSLQTASVYGQVVDTETSQAIRDVRIRFSSDDLIDSPGTLTIETETDGDGIFNRSLLPGNWTAELIPEFDTDWAPTRVAFTVSRDANNLDLGQLQLPDRISFSSVAVDDASTPVAGAAVNARELGFDGYIYSTTTADDGRFALLLPPSPVSLMVDPPGEELAVTNVFVNPAGEPGSVLVPRGQRVEGQITSVGAGVGFALIEVRDIAGTLYATALTDPNGRFHLRMESF
ncbi:MAG: carboxypeptidase-like regulatory domain-containing protein [Myxococcota bacterium]|nr:carboxypeptidase-like regulatory domain-containing protein [Myxococcota bacterium]